MNLTASFVCKQMRIVAITQGLDPVVVYFSSLICRYAEDLARLEGKPHFKRRGMSCTRRWAMILHRSRPRSRPQPNNWKLRPVYIRQGGKLEEGIEQELNPPSSSFREELPLLLLLLP